MQISSLASRLRIPNLVIGLTIVAVGTSLPELVTSVVAALVAAKKFRLAEEKLLTLTKIIKVSATGRTEFGFNEWLKAQDGKPMGQDWQTWSASMYLYAAKCVEEKRTPFFEEMRC